MKFQSSRGRVVELTVNVHASFDSTSYLPFEQMHLIEGLENVISNLESSVFVLYQLQDVYLATVEGRETVHPDGEYLGRYFQNCTSPSTSVHSPRRLYLPYWE